MRHHSFLIVITIALFSTFISPCLDAQWVKANGNRVVSVASLVVSQNSLIAGSMGGAYISPDNGSTWTFVSFGRTGGTVKALVVSGTSLFAGTDGEGVFRSRDNGMSWMAVDSGLTFKDINAFAVSGGNLIAGSSGGILRSTDDGTSWTYLGLQFNIVTALTASGDSLFAGTNDGHVYCSTNSGTDWSWGGGASTKRIYALAVGGTSVYAGTDGEGILRTDNNGMSWSPANYGMSDPWIRALAFYGEGLFAGTYYNGVYRSTNGGVTWGAINNGLAGGGCAFAFSGTNLFVVTTRGIYMSTNNGDQWIPITLGLMNLNVQALAVSDNNIFAGTVSGVYLSTNSGTTWTNVSSGFPYLFPNVGGVAVRDRSIFAIALGGLGVYRSSIDGVYWGEINAGLPDTYAHALAATGANVFVVVDAGVYKFVDATNSWVAASSGLGNLCRPLAASGGNLIGGTWEGIFVSTDNGTSWTVKLPLSNSDFGAIGVNENVVYAGTYTGSMYRSTDKGETWTSITGWDGNGGIRSFAFSELNIFTGTAGNGVYRSTDTGTSWTPINTGLTSFDIRSLAVCGTDLFAGTDGGVWRRPLLEVGVDPAPWSVPLKYELYQNFPNPFNPTTVIRYVLPVASHVTLNIYDMLGREVSVLLNERRDAGVHEVKFDATGLSSGVYFYRLAAGSFVQTRKLLLLK
jgi:hypothetical protein